jgi:hypothetical protein
MKALMLARDLCYLNCFGAGNSRETFPYVVALFGVLPGIPGQAGALRTGPWKYTQSCIRSSRRVEPTRCRTSKRAAHWTWW